MGNFFSDIAKAAGSFIDPTNALGIGMSGKKGWLTGSNAQGSGKTKKGWKGAFSGTAPSGTGTSFLSSLNWGAAGGPSMEQLASNPYGGGRGSNYSPAFLAAFLKGEMGPGGFLGAASQQRQTAVGLGQIIGGGEVDVAANERAMAAAGVASPALAAMRSANRSVMAEQARGYLTQRRAEQDELRYSAMEGFVNNVMQTVAAQKNMQQADYAAKKAAKATQRAGIISGVATVAGAVLGGPAGAALAATAAGAVNANQNK